MTLTMYLVVRELLGMSSGKIAAQVGHAVQYSMTEYGRRCEQWGRSLSPTPPQDTQNFALWLAVDSRKVVLGADDRQWAKLREQAPIVVKDDGHTEVQAGSETVLAFWPMRKSERPALLKRLRLL